MLRFLLLALGLFSTATLGAENGCITFSVGQGTGCDWMCNYCSNILGTNNYYFADSVCTYEKGGCVGNPIAGKQYTCCAVSLKDEYNDEL